MSKLSKPSFSCDVRLRTTRHFSLQSTWCGSSIMESFPRWITSNSGPPCLVVHYCWQIWLERNRVLFEDAKPSLPRVFYKVLASFNWQSNSIRVHPQRALTFDLAEGHSLAFFDGAAQSNGSRCGAGGFFKSHQSRITNWFINCGSGTNTKAELLGLWTTLTLAALWSIDDLHVQGDSRVIIDWITNKSKLNSIHLEGWMQKTRDLLQRFSNINFLHVPRSHNKAADVLSKRALSEVVGRLSIYHCDKGIESPITTLNIFE
jgi:ribonuclease HI